MVTPTMPLRAARHIARSRIAQSADVPSFVKLSPATNSSTGREVVPLSPRVATLSRFWWLSEYFRPRDNDKPEQGSSLGSVEDWVSSTSPAFIGPGALCGHSG